MHLPSNAYLPYGKARLAALDLPFIEHKGNSVQKCQDGRTALTPKIDLRDYRFTAVVDWIKFRVTYLRSSNFMKTQAVLATGVGQGVGGEVLVRCRCLLKSIRPV